MICRALERASASVPRSVATRHAFGRTRSVILFPESLNFLAPVVVLVILFKTFLQDQIVRKCTSKIADCQYWIRFRRVGGV